MLQILETRLDNVVYHLGFGTLAPPPARLVGHGHVKVNGRKVNISSYALKVNDVVEVKDSNVSRQIGDQEPGNFHQPRGARLGVADKNAFKGTVMRVPTRDEIQPIANEQAVVEFYSR